MDDRADASNSGRSSNSGCRGRMPRQARGQHDQVVEHVTPMALLQHFERHGPDEFRQEGIVIAPPQRRHVPHVGERSRDEPRIHLDDDHRHPPAFRQQNFLLAPGARVIMFTDEGDEGGILDEFGEGGYVVARAQLVGIVDVREARLPDDVIEELRGGLRPVGLRVAEEASQFPLRGLVAVLQDADQPLRDMAEEPPFRVPSYRNAYRSPRGAAASDNATGKTDVLAGSSPSRRGGRIAGSSRIICSSMSGTKTL